MNILGILTIGRESIVMLNFLASIIYLIFGLVVFEKNRKSATNIFFACACFSLFLWAIGTSLYQCAPEESSLLWARIDYALSTFMGTAMLYFCFTFPSEKLTLKWKMTFLPLLPNFLIFYLTLWKNGVIEKVIFYYDRQKEIVFNPFFYKFYMAYYFIYFGAGLFFLFKNYFSSQGAKKRQLAHVMISFSLVISIGLFFNLILIMPEINIFDFDWLGPLATLLLPILIGLAIIKYQLMNIRIVGTEIFLSFICIIFFIQMLFSQNFYEFSLRFILLFLVILFSFFLIRGTFREIDQLKRLGQMKSEFVSIVSHQLRTPLTAAKGYLSLLIDGTYGSLDAKPKEILEKVFISNERLIRLINDLLNVSLMDYNKLGFKFERFSFENMVSGIVDELKIGAFHKNLFLAWEKPAKPLPQILGDSEKLYQAILNIIDNAIKYTKQGGITVKIEETERDNIKKLLLIISDTGEGIEPDRLESIFEGFDRGERISKLHIEGKGLGLNFSKKIVLAHHGKIWAESEGPGEGSTFFIELPVNF